MQEDLQLIQKVDTARRTSDDLIGFQYAQPIYLRIKSSTTKPFWDDGPPVKVLCEDESGVEHWVMIADKNALDRDPKKNPHRYAVMVPQLLAASQSNDDGVPRIAGIIMRLADSNDTMEVIRETVNATLQGGAKAVNNVNVLYSGNSAIVVGEDAGVDVRYKGEPVIAFGPKIIQKKAESREFLPGSEDYTFLNPRSWLSQILPRGFMPGFNIPHIGAYMTIIIRAGSMVSEAHKFFKAIRGV